MEGSWRGDGLRATELLNYLDAPYSMVYLYDELSRALEGDCQNYASLHAAVYRISELELENRSFATFDQLQLGMSHSPRRR